MKKKYNSPICDSIFYEEELLNVDSNFGTGGANTEGNVPGGLGGNADNGENGGGVDIDPDDVGAKGGLIWDDSIFD